MKKIFAFVLACIFALSMLPAFAETAEETEESKWVNILLLGGDARKDSNFDRTDTMILLSVNHEDRQMKMTSIMRDIYVKYPTKNYSAKLNAAQVYGGPELTVATISGVLDVEIDSYVLINMTDLVEIIDAVGGVTVNISGSERYYINYYAADYLTNIRRNYDGETTLEVSEGDVHLNGLLAVSYARNRYSDSEFARVMRQQEILVGLAHQLQEMELDEAMAMDLQTTLMQHIVTDMTDEEIKELAMTCLVVDIESISHYRIPVSGTFHVDEELESSIIMDVEENAAYLHDFIYGDGEGLSFE